MNKPLYKRHPEFFELLKYPQEMMRFYHGMLEYVYIPIDEYGEFPIVRVAISSYNKDVGHKDIEGVITTSFLPNMGDYARGFIDGYNNELTPFIDTIDARKQRVIKAANKNIKSFVVSCGENGKELKHLYDDGFYEGERYKAWEIIFQAPNEFAGYFSHNLEGSVVPVKTDAQIVDIIDLEQEAQVSLEYIQTLKLDDVQSAIQEVLLWEVMINKISKLKSESSRIEWNERDHPTLSFLYEKFKEIESYYEKDEKCSDFRKALADHYGIRPDELPMYWPDNPSNELTDISGRLYTYNGMAEALKAYITGASDTDLQTIICHKVLPAGAIQKEWIGSKVDAHRFCHKFDLKVAQFNKCFKFKDSKLLAAGQKKGSVMEKDGSIWNIISKYPK